MESCQFCSKRTCLLQARVRRGGSTGRALVRVGRPEDGHDDICAAGGGVPASRRRVDAGRRAAAPQPGPRLLRLRGMGALIAQSGAHMQLVEERRLIPLCGRWSLRRCTSTRTAAFCQRHGSAGCKDSGTYTQLVRYTAWVLMWGRWSISRRTATRIAALCLHSMGAYRTPGVYPLLVNRSSWVPMCGRWLARCCTSGGAPTSFCLRGM